MYPLFSLENPCTNDNNDKRITLFHEIQCVYDKMTSGSHIKSVRDTIDSCIAHAIISMA